MQLLALGMFIFEVSSLAYEDLQRRASWRHARSQRVGARDATQFVGPGEETINLGGAVWTEICDGQVSLDELRDMADAGEAYALVTGQGDVVGFYVIEGLDERHSELMADGQARVIDFSLSLLRVDDPSQAASGQPSETAA
jgi:phage protein U